jgi:hypothetical protein
MDLTEIGLCAMDWINLAEGRDQWRVLMGMVLNLRVSYNVRKFLSS